MPRQNIGSPRSAGNSAGAGDIPNYTDAELDALIAAIPPSHTEAWQAFADARLAADLEIRDTGVLSLHAMALVVDSYRTMCSIAGWPPIIDPPTEEARRWRAKHYAKHRR